jgi:hypothetical protein
MTTDASQLDKVEPYTGKDKVIVGNGSSNILKELCTLVSKLLHPPPSTSQLSQMPTGLAVQIPVDQHLNMPSS